MDNYATVTDVAAFTGKTYTADEQTRINQLCQDVSDRLRQCAFNVGKNLDEMIMNGNPLMSVVRSVTVDVVVRCLATPTDDTPMTQYSQSALGYSVSGTYLVPGGGIFIKNSELRLLGLHRQRFGVIEPYDSRNNGHTC
ncbi:MAG: hypothetical protein IKE94_08955 [Aeriscardovia sp.]|nr:hypothetical protein [Aeriscardovia sp.]